MVGKVSGGFVFRLPTLTAQSATMDWIEVFLWCQCCPFPRCDVTKENIVLLVPLMLTEARHDALIVMLTKWFSLTRLETRTKESNIYASI